MRGLQKSLAFAVAGAVVVALLSRSAKAADVSDDAFTRYDPLFKRASRKHAIPWRWLKAIAMGESSLGTHRTVLAGLKNPGSPEGLSIDKLSRGLMQVTMKTANEPYMRPGTTEADLDNPEISVELAAKYLAWVRRNYHADRDSIIRSYNGGPGFAKGDAADLAAGRAADTLAYLEKFKRNLATVLARQPGNEMETG